MRGGFCWTLNPLPPVVARRALRAEALRAGRTAWLHRIRIPAVLPPNQVRSTGVEPATSCPPDRRSTKLSYDLMTGPLGGGPACPSIRRTVLRFDPRPVGRTTSQTDRI